MSKDFDHDDSITRVTRSYISKTDDIPYFSTSTNYALPTCEASEDGIACWHHADEEYHTKAFTMNGISYPSEIRHVCKACYDRMWEIILARHLIGREVRGAA